MGKTVPAKLAQARRDREAVPVNGGLFDIGSRGNSWRTRQQKRGGINRRVRNPSSERS
jgi:hypothetical protein